MPCAIEPAQSGGGPPHSRMLARIRSTGAIPAHKAVPHDQLSNQAEGGGNSRSRRVKSDLSPSNVRRRSFSASRTSSCRMKICAQMPARQFILKSGCSVVVSSSAQCPRSIVSRKWSSSSGNIATKQWGQRDAVARRRLHFLHFQILKLKVNFFRCSNARQSRNRNPARTTQPKTSVTIPFGE